MKTITQIYLIIIIHINHKVGWMYEAIEVGAYIILHLHRLWESSHHKTFRLVDRCYRHIDTSFSQHIGIECDGLRWHNETHKPKNYHLEKTKACEEKGVRLIHIFEDEWVYNSEIWKSMLRNMFGKTENRIYARNCEVREVNAREKRRFLKHNHIQGNAQSRYSYGLFHETVFLGKSCKWEAGKKKGHMNLSGSAIK